MARICFDARAIREHMTGVGVYCDRLLRAMTRGAADGEGEAHQWLLPHLPGAPLDAYAGRNDVILSETTADYGDHPGGEWWLNVTLPRLLKETETDLIHGPAYLIPWRGGRARKIVTIHDLVCFRYPESFPPQFAWYMRQVVRLSARRADGIIAVSQSCANDLAEQVGVDPAKIRVIHHGPGPGMAPPAPEAVEWVRRQYGLERDYVIYVGTLEPRKGLTRMIRVLERMVRAGRDVDLVLAGRVGWRAEGLLRAMEMSSARSRLRRLDYVPDAHLPALYGGAVALWYLSDYEGFGLPPLEAMACGCPVIVSDCSSLPEVVGQAGVRVNPDDLDAVAETTCWWMDDLDERGRRMRWGLRRAAGFSWERSARETLAFYRHILNP